MKLCKIGKLNLARAFAFITVLCVVMLWGIDSYADTWGSGSYLNDNIAIYYGGDNTTAPIFNSQEMTSVFTENGFTVVPDFVNYLGLYNTSTTLDLFPDYFHWLNEADIDNVHYQGSVGMPIVCLARSAYQFQYMNYYFIGTTNPCIVVDNYGQWFVFSETDFSIVTHLSAPYSEYRNNDVVTTTNSNGLYYKVINAFGGNYPFYYDFTNMPIYVISQDGSTGVTSLDSFSYQGSSGNPLFNFNYLFTDGDYVDPNAPTVDPDDVVQPYSSDGIHYVFGTVEPQFISDGVKDDAILAKYDMHMNDYMLNHPSQYDFVYEYQMKVVSTSGDYVFRTDGSANIADILAGGGKDQTYWVNTPFTYFETNDNLSLNTFLQTVFTGLGSPISQYTDGAVVSYGIGNPSNTRTFGKFTLGVRQNYLNTIQSMKFYYKCYYVWNGDPVTTSGKLAGYKDLLTGHNKTTQNDISNNYNPPSENLNNNYPSTNGGGNNNGSGSFYDGDVTVINQDSNVPWTPYTLDQISYGNVKDMFNDIKDFIDSTSSNSFWQVLDRTFSYIPDKIWQYITITIAVICGFAVVRYVLRR